MQPILDGYSLNKARVEGVVSLRSRKAEDSLERRRQEIMQPLPNGSRQATPLQRQIEEFLREDPNYRGYNIYEVTEGTEQLMLADTPEASFPSLRRIFTILTLEQSAPIGEFIDAGLDSVLIEKLRSPLFFDNVFFLAASLQILSTLLYSPADSVAKMLDHGILEPFTRALDKDLYCIKMSYCYCVGNSLAYVSRDQLSVMLSEPYSVHTRLIKILGTNANDEFRLAYTAVWALSNITRKREEQAQSWLTVPVAVQIMDTCMQIYLSSEPQGLTPKGRKNFTNLRRQSAWSLGYLLQVGPQITERIVYNDAVLNTVASEIYAVKSASTWASCRIAGLVALVQDPKYSMRLIQFNIHRALALVCQIHDSRDNHGSQATRVVAEAAWALSNVASLRETTDAMLDQAVLGPILTLCGPDVDERVRNEATWAVINSVFYFDTKQIIEAVNSCSILEYFAAAFCRTDSHFISMLCDSIDKIFKVAQSEYGIGSPVWGIWVGEFATKGGIANLQAILTAPLTGRDIQKATQGAKRLLTLLADYEENDNGFRLAEQDTSPGPIDFQQIQCWISMIPHVVEKSVEKKFIVDDLPIPPHGEPRPCSRSRFCLASLYFLVTSVFCAIHIFIMSWYNHGGNATRFFYRFFLHADLTVIGKDEIRESHRGVILTSHKSWADFIAISFFNNSMVLGRMAVAFAFPLLWLSNFFAHYICFFHRGGNSTNRDKFEQSIINSMKKNPRLLIYPEGTRGVRRGVLRIRSGMLRFAYKYNLPVLVAPCEGAQYVFNEHTGVMPRFTGPRGHYVLNVVSVVDPKDFPAKNDTDEAKEEAFQQFYKYIQEQFIDGYKEACRVYDEKIRAEWDGSRPYFSRAVRVDQSRELIPAECTEEPAADTLQSIMYIVSELFAIRDDLQKYGYIKDAKFSCEPEDFDPNGPCLQTEFVITTLEGKEYEITLSTNGYMITDPLIPQTYESFAQLMTDISPEYCQRFVSLITEQLSRKQLSRTDNGDE